MIPCYGTHGSRHRINNKSIQEKYKIQILSAETYGYVVQFWPYQSARKEKQVASSTKYGLGENIVLRLMECLTPTFSFDIFWMTISYLSSLYPPWSQQHRAIGMFNKKRLRKCTIIGDKQPQKKERGQFEKRTSSKKAVQIWLERQQAAYIAFSEFWKTKVFFRCWSKAERKDLQEQKPNKFHCYN